MVLEAPINSSYNPKGPKEQCKQPKIMEIFTPKEKNDQILKAYFNNLIA